MKKIIKSPLILILLFVLLFSLFSCGESEFKVNFIVDGETYFTLQATENRAVEMPAEPTKSEHVFDGWFIDSEKWNIPFGENYFIGKKHSTDIYVYAKWTYVHSHVAGEWITLTESSCSDAGVKTKKCIHCDETLETEAIPPLPHTEVTVKGILQTDTQDGLTDGSYCSVCGTIVRSQERIPANIQGADLKSELFKKDGLTLSITLPNSESEISIIERVIMNHKATASLSYDEDGKEPITGAAKLLEGDNRFYLAVTNGEDRKIYEINIRRRPNYTLTFLGLNAEAVATLTVEEGALATAPDAEASRLGYTFSGWDFDFSAPVFGDATVNAVWTPNADTAYTVEHYLVNKDETPSLYDTQSLTAVTDALVAAEALSIENYAYREDLSTSSGAVLPDGSLTLRLYYEKVLYTVKFDTASDEKIENAVVPFDAALQKPKEIENGDCVFMGWYLGDTEWNFDTDTVTEDITLTAKWGYRVTFIADGAATEVIVERGKTVSEPEVAEKSKFTFLGWRIRGSNTNWDFNTPITEHITLEAKWIPIMPIAPI